MSRWFTVYWSVRQQLHLYTQAYALLKHEENPSVLMCKFHIFAFFWLKRAATFIFFRSNKIKCDHMRQQKINQAAIGLMDPLGTLIH